MNKDMKRFFVQSLILLLLPLLITSPSLFAHGTISYYIMLSTLDGYIDVKIYDNNKNSFLKEELGKRNSPKKS